MRSLSTSARWAWPRVTLLILLCIWQPCVAKAAHPRQEPPPPAWSVDPANFQFNMSAIIRIRFDSVPTTNTGNVVGAFVGTELRGVATEVEIFGEQYYFMTIYSNTYIGEVVKFKAYYAPDDAIYTAMQADTFIHSKSIGTVGMPFWIDIDPDFDFPPEVLATLADTTLQGIPFGTYDLTDYIYSPDDDTITWSLAPGPNLTATDTNGILTVTPLLSNWIGTDTVRITAVENTPNQFSVSITGLFTVLPDYPLMLLPIPPQVIFKGETFNPFDLDDFVIGDSCRMFGFDVSPFSGNAPNPVWSPPPPGLQPMTVVARALFVDEQPEGPDAMLAAFVNGVLAGTAPPAGVPPNVSYTLTLTDVGSGPITFQFYHAENQYLYNKKTTLNFVPGGSVGTAANPYAIQFSPLVPVLAADGGVVIQIVDTAWTGIYPVTFIAWDCDYPDSKRDSATTSFSIVVDNRPHFSSPLSVNFEENACYVLYDAQTSDPNDSEGDGLTYDLAGGPDAAKFSIDFITGILSWMNFAPDFENPADTNGDNIYQVNIRVTNLLNLSDTLELTITVTDNPNEPFVAMINGGASQICFLGSASLQASGGGTYSWNTGATTASITVTTANTYTVTVTSTGACTASASIVARIRPTLTAAGSNTPVCQGAPITLSSTPAGGSGTYTTFTWTGPDNYIANAEDPPAFPATPAKAGIYTVMVTDDTGCTATATTSISVSANSAPMITAASNSPVICTGTNITLSSMPSGGSGTYTAYLWVGPNNYTSALQNPLALLATLPYSGTYTVKVTDNAGCTATGTVSVQVNPSPSILAMNNSPLCIGQTIGLSSSPSGGSGNYTAFTWAGPNYTANVEDPDGFTADLATAGAYTVTVTDGLGCTGTGSTTVVVYSLPSVTAMLLAPVCEGGQVVLGATTSGGSGTYTAFVWSGPNGFNSSVKNPPAFPADSTVVGTYTVTVTDNIGCAANGAVAVEINPSPSIVAGNNGPVCLGGGLGLHSTPSDGTPPYTTFFWSGPGGYVAGVQDPTPFWTTMNSPGTYTVTVTDNKGCTATGTTLAIVTPKPSITAANNGPLCQNTLLNLISTPSSGTPPYATFSWSGPNNFTASVEDPPGFPATPLASGFYRVTVTDQMGCTATASTGVAVSTIMAPTITATSESPICAGENLVLNSTPSGGSGSYIAYNWAGPNGYSATVRNPAAFVAEVASAGTYTVTVTDHRQCTGTGTVAVDVNAPEVEITSNSPICVGIGNVVLGCTPSGGSGTYVSFDWEGPDNFSSSEQNPTPFPAVPEASGTYTVTVTDSEGCTGTAEENVVAGDDEAPVFEGLPTDVSLTVDCAADLPEIPVVTASDNSGVPVDVQFSENTTPGDCPNQFTVTRTWTAEDGCENSTIFIQTITVNDTQAPVLENLPAEMTVSVDCSDEVPPAAAVTATDNCDLTVLVVLTETYQPGGCPNQYTLTRSWTAEDDCGNSTAFVQTITVNDTQAPVLENLPAETTITVACSDEIPPASAVTATDNCDPSVVVALAETIQPGSCPNQYSLIRTWTAADACGNSTFFIQTITVNDDISPDLSCPADTLVMCSVNDVAEFDNLPEFYAAGGSATDNCGLNGSTFGLASQTRDGDIYTRIYQMTDICGNTGTCAQLITVHDSISPVFVNCPANITVGNDVDKCGANVVFSTPIATDNCDSVTVEQTTGLPSGDLFPVGTTTVTFVAADTTGNTVSCQFAITVMDMQAPMPGCQDITIYLDTLGQATVSALLIAGMSSDNCPGALTLELSQTLFDCSQVGDNNDTLTISDLAGNTAICIVTVTVRDVLKPTFTCPAAQFLDSCDGLVPDLVALVTDAADNCGVSSISQNPVAGTDFGNNNGQSIAVTISVVDTNGNVATCVVPVTIIDTVPPVFLNCPDTMIMIGNDVDKCSGKLNWAQPVASDNCVLTSVVQIDGPASGTIIPVGQPQTVVYRAFDSAGNSSTCAFDVQVVDTQIPELDDDILMPGDVTVECDAVPPPFVLTKNDVHDNCTPRDSLEIDFTEVRTDGNCPFNYILTRTWTVTDQAGNMRVHTQIVTVQDTQAPTAICKDITIVLDKFGDATITGADVNDGSFDNCSAQADLMLSVVPDTFSCANLGENIATLTVTDECGNSASCTAIVTVGEGVGSCEPQYSVVTSCMNNATTLDDGQFQDLITVHALAGQTWTITTNTGFYAISSPAPPEIPVLLPIGTPLIMGTADGLDNDNDGEIDEADEMVYYTLIGLHVDVKGYSISLGNSLGQTGTITNKAYYPTPYFTNLYDPFCIETPPFVIEVGEYNNAQGVVTQIMVNGVQTNIFDAEVLGLGFHTVMAVFDAGAPTTNLVINGQLVGGTDAEAQADPGCQQKITKVIQIVSTPTTVVCNDLVHVSLDADCVEDINPDDVLEGTYACFDDYSVVLTYPPGTNSYDPPNRVDATHAGKFLDYILVHALSGNLCSGQIKVEDKLAPEMICPPDLEILCVQNDDDLSITGAPEVSDCSELDVIYTDDYVTFNCSDDTLLARRIYRTWKARDAFGNESTCVQVIDVLRGDFHSVVFPTDKILDCTAAGPVSSPNVSGWPQLGGINLTPAGNGVCGLAVSYIDNVTTFCPGAYRVIRNWKISSLCVLNANLEYTQYIQVNDLPPAILLPQSSYDSLSDCYIVPINTSGTTCFTAGPLPVAQIEGVCDNVVHSEVATPLGVIANGAILPQPGLAPGEYSVTYSAEDECGNISQKTVKICVVDNTPPTSVCDEFTQVALGATGEAQINAETFDDGSYDNCAPVVFKARRMDPSNCQTDSLFYDQVEFCCDDINDTVRVIFRVYDVPVQSGAIGLEEYEGHHNDCMVTVFVEDKIKPTCEAPANVTISCLNFDPSLGVYDLATTEDNCCIDTITVTNNYSLFDTLCSKGTITRTFRAFDCGGLSSQCSQRIYVTYEQDYFVKFPNDVIVTACDGTGNFGEPTFLNQGCGLLGISFEDEIFTVVPDACFKIERSWTVINWCTFNPNAGCIDVPNPNPNAAANHPSNLPGPVVSAAGTPLPWQPTIVAIAPGQSPTNYSTFWDINANCYRYKQIINILDTQDPLVENCPDSTVVLCDVTANADDLWNDSGWWDPLTDSHDLCEGFSDLSIIATDLCSDANISFRFLLFLDLDGDGVMESVVSSVKPPDAGIVNVGNAQNPDFIGGVPTPFDQRPVLPEQKYRFSIQENLTGTKRTASLRWNNQQQPTNFVVPELPYGRHKIKWIVTDGCGNETVCEYDFVVKDCKAPSVVCINGLSVNIMPVAMTQLWDVDFLKYADDNCTPANQIVTAIRKSGTGTGFPLNPDGTPQKGVQFDCTELGTQLVELWAMDLAGNVDYCETYVIVQDNIGVCSLGDKASIAGFLKTEEDNGLEEGIVELEGNHPALPPVSFFNLSDQNGIYGFPNAVPLGANYTVIPTYDNDPLNGVSTFDLVLINKHILGVQPLASPYKIIAADANNSRSITTFDMVEMRKLILGIISDFGNNSSWRFVDKSYVFPNPANPFQEIFPETKSVADVQDNHFSDDFVSVKVGDVNGNAKTNHYMQVDDRTDGELLFDVMLLENLNEIKAGEVFTVRFQAVEKVFGYQFTLCFPDLEVLAVSPGTEMTMGNFGIFNDRHCLTTSFDNDRLAGIFDVTFRAHKAGIFSQMIKVSGQITRAEAYATSSADDRLAIALRFISAGETVIAGQGFEVYQNQPNPWVHRTQIGFYLPEASTTRLTVFDESGRTVYALTGDYKRGYNAFVLESSLMYTTGVLYYKIETATDNEVRKMVFIR